MAAGHPRLNFEFGAFQANMPHHWEEKGVNKGPGFDARAWAVGQAVSVRTALDLLAHRAADDKAPWPEFTEYDCFACHHDLTPPGWRQKKEHFGPFRPGSLPWATWYTALPRLLADAGPATEPDLGKALDKLQKEMRKVRPDRKAAAARAGQASEQARQWLAKVEKLPYDKPDTVADLRRAVAQQGAAVAGTSWDGAAQVYLALVALSAPDPNRDVREALNKVAADLAFPGDAKGPRYESPKGYRSKGGFQEDLSALLKNFP
jgi:hypothetical protein